MPPLPSMSRLRNVGFAFPWAEQRWRVCPSPGIPTPRARADHRAPAAHSCERIAGDVGSVVLPRRAACRFAPAVGCFVPRLWRHLARSSCASTSDRKSMPWSHNLVEPCWNPANCQRDTLQSVCLQAFVDLGGRDEEASETGAGTKSTVLPITSPAVKPRTMPEAMTALLMLGMEKRLCMKK